MPRNAPNDVRRPFREYLDARDGSAAGMNHTEQRIATNATPGAHGMARQQTPPLTQSPRPVRPLGENLILAHESEQRRIARELHDQIGQDLTALKITLRRAKNACAGEAQKFIQEAETLTEEVLQNVRGICVRLSPPVLDDLGLVAGIQSHIKTFATRTGLDVTFDLGGHMQEARLSPLVKATIFRVIQEALTNVSRHGQTHAASVMLAMRNAGVEFSIRDGGKGFEANDAANWNSTGISSMKERLSLVGGKFQIASSPGHGTIITASIPVLHDPTQ